MKRTLRIWAIFLSISLFGASCPIRAGDFVEVYGFDLAYGHLYYGKKSDPKKIKQLTDLDLETEWIAMQLRDWTIVKNRLATCN